jgi:hypothetical protein
VEGSGVLQEGGAGAAGELRGSNGVEAFVGRGVWGGGCDVIDTAARQEKLGGRNGVTTRDLLGAALVHI